MNGGSNMKEIGVEVEAFIADKEGKVVEPRKIGLPIDDCGFLAEVRTESHTESYLLAAEIYKELNSLKKRVLEQGYDILDNHVYKPTSKERRHFALEYGKEYETVYSIYTTEDRMSFEKRTWTAGLHVHFSNINTLKTEKQTIQIPSIINIPQIIRKLDNIFKDEIRKIHERLS